MAIGKEVRTKINSIKSTQKITSAMEMVAASKMRRAQERMAMGKPYAEHIRAIINNVASASSKYRHHYLEEREIKRVGYIVVSTDRGLCGGLNVNLFKAVTKAYRGWMEQGVEVDFCAIGAKAMGFFGQYGGKVVAAKRDLGDRPVAAELIGSVRVMLEAFEEGRIDRVYVAGNEFVNTMTQKASLQQILPIPKHDEDQFAYRWDYIYEPDDEEILDQLLVRFIESQVYQAAVENKACEMAARMIAMKNATDNAGNLIDELELLYNKARQAAITQELSEIVGGASAV